VTEACAPPVIVDRVSGTDRAKRYRHPSDVARLIFALLVVGAMALLEAIVPLGLLSVTIDILTIVSDLPSALTDGMVGLVQLAATLAPLVAVVVLVKHRAFVLLLILALDAGIAALSMALLSGTVDNSIPISELDFEGTNSWFIGSQYPSSTYVAALTAMLVAASPWLPRAWRITGWVFMVAVIMARVLSATDVPLRNGMLLALGAASGSAALLVFGAPRRRIDVTGVAGSLQRAGLDVARIAPFAHTGPDPLFEVELSDGRHIVVKVLGRDQRDADLLLAAWRSLTVKGLGDAGAIRSPGRAVQHEVVTMGIFDAAGIAAPRAHAVVTTPDEAAVLAMTKLPGRELATMGGGEVIDAAICDAFRQVGMLQRRRLAHRSLNAGNVLVDEDSAAFVTLRRADLEASDEELGADIAELLVSFGLVVGIDRAIGAGRTELTTEQLDRAVPLIQSAVFTRATRRRLDELDDHDAFLDDLRDRVADAGDVEHVELSPIRRITFGGAVGLVGGLVLVWYVLSLAADWDQIWEAFTTANLSFIPPILVLAFVPYFTGALSMMGAVPIELPFFRTTSVMFGQSYLNRFTPANAGGMAMRIRYLQLSGLDGAVSATSIALTSAASGVAQGLLIVVFLFWGGASDRFSDFETPDVGGIIIAILIIGLLAAIVLLLTPWGREQVRPLLVQIFGRIRATLAELAKDPKKMSQLFGGALLGKLANISAFWLSTLAFDVDISFPKAGALYIIATTIGSAVPTPGGVGGVEAALTAALLSFGVDNATAAGIVLFFRILTFWLPTIPGYGFLRYTQRKGIV
jgi:uncharacterized protein (TIRG00374 family)